MSCRASETAQVANVADIATARADRSGRSDRSGCSERSDGSGMPPKVNHADRAATAGATERQFRFGDVVLAHLLGLVVGAALVGGLALIFGLTARYLAHSG